jgi:streptogramin lyase
MRQHVEMGNPGPEQLATVGKGVQRVAGRKGLTGTGGPAWLASRVALIGLLGIVSQLQPPRVSGTGTPQIEEPILAVIHGRPSLGQPVSDPLVIRGLGFGIPGSSSSLEFTYGEETASVPSTGEAITAWTDDEIRVVVPDQVDTGSLKVIADGEPSSPVEFLVYEYDSFDIPTQPGTNAYGLALAVAPDGKIWMNREFHLRLQVFDPADRHFDMFPDNGAIPQAPGRGVFSVFQIVKDPDVRSWTSHAGEDLEIGADGNVWFTQGGAAYYPGRGNSYEAEVDCDPGTDPACHYCISGDPDSGACKTNIARWLNTSRVIEYDPTTDQFSCFNSPLDNSIVHGVLVDDARGIIWYAEGKTNDTAPEDAGNAITGITIDSVLSNCLFDPYDKENQRRDAFCANGPEDDCHLRFPVPPLGNEISHLELDQGGNIWFTMLFGRRVGRLNPETGDVKQLEFPEPIVPGFGNGTWELSFDRNNHLWVTEYLDATVSRVKPELMSAANDYCQGLDESGQNPCIEEMFVGQNEAQDARIHSLDIAPDDKVWFAVTKDEQSYPEYHEGHPVATVSQVGFISPAHNDAAVTLPILRSQYDPQYGPAAHPLVDGIGETAGVVVDDRTGDVYFMEGTERQLGRLHLGLAPDADSDGIPDEVDNCPSVANPDQANTPIGPIDNGPGVAGDDATVPFEDGVGDACDEDADNDGLSDSDEEPLANCGAFNGIVADHPSPAGGDVTDDDDHDGDPAMYSGSDRHDDGPSWDTDDDGALDGVECALGHNPRSQADRPNTAECGGLGDTDADGLLDAWETCGWGTNAGVIDSDGDGSGDCVEAADTDGNRVVDFGVDTLNAVRGTLLAPGRFGKTMDFDIDKNGSVDFGGDVLTLVRFAFRLKLCQ